MTTFTDTIIETFHVVSCYTCSIRFGITRELHRRVVTDAQGSVFCPACGNRSCWRESADQKVIKELQKKLEWEAAECARQKTLRDQADARAASYFDEKSKVERKLKRVHAGICPYCNRFVKQLARHMETKHHGKPFVPAKLSTTEKAKAKGFKTT